MTPQQKLELEALRYPYILAGGGLLVTAGLIWAIVYLTGIRPANFTEFTAAIGVFTGLLGTLIGTLVGVKVGGAAGEKAANTLAGQMNANAEALRSTHALLATAHEQLATKSDLLEKALAALPSDQARGIKTP